jgi:methylmalonyl-CoA/ethylmalonyl-CoA epimerase
MQICFVTDNLEKSLAWFADLTGKEPSHIGKAADPDEAKAVYHGKPASVGCRLAMFKFANIDVEFLEPGPEKSAWRDLLEEKGPGCHHIAFRTRNMTKRAEYLEGKGHSELQRAEFDGAHGRYAYFDTVPQLGVQIELLEWNSDMEKQN